MPSSANLQKSSDLSSLKDFSVSIERRNAVRPCAIYSLKIDAAGKSSAERSCVIYPDLSECSHSESNGISFEKRRCERDEIEKKEKQLNDEEMKALMSEIIKSQFFSFEDDYSFDSSNCSSISTDSPNSILKIRFQGKEKTIEHYYGCHVKNWTTNDNALQPLSDLETKINEVSGIPNWNTGRK